MTTIPVSHLHRRARLASMMVLSRSQLQPQAVLQLQVQRGEADGRLAEQAVAPHALAAVHAHAQA